MGRVRRVLWLTWLLWFDLVVIVVAAFWGPSLATAVGLSVLQVLIQVYGILMAFTAVIFSTVYASLSSPAVQKTGPEFQVKVLKPRYDALKAFLKASVAILVVSIVGMVLCIPLVASMVAIPSVLLVIWTVPLCLEAGAILWFAEKV
jgi:hypothetical protein